MSKNPTDTKSDSSEAPKYGTARRLYELGKDPDAVEEIFENARGDRGEDDE